MSRAQPELICHLAAPIDVRVSVTEPVRDAQINVDGTVNVLEVGARVLFASSGGALYGRDAPVPSAEDVPPQPGQRDEAAWSGPPRRVLSAGPDTARRAASTHCYLAASFPTHLAPFPDI